MDGHQQSWDIVRLVDTLGRHRGLIGTCSLAAAIVAGILAWFVLPKVYRAKAVFMVRESQIEQQRTPLRQADVKLYEAIIKNQNVLKRLVEEFDLPPKKYKMRRLEKMVHVEAMKNAPLLELSVEFEKEPAMARDVALFIVNQAEVKNASLEQQELLEGRRLLEEEESDALELLRKSEQDLLATKERFNLEALEAELGVLLNEITSLRVRLTQIDKQLAIQEVDPVFEDYWAKRTEVEQDQKEARLSLRRHEIEILQQKKAEATVDLFRLNAEIASKEAEIQAIDDLVAAMPIIKSSTRALLTDPEYYLAAEMIRPGSSSGNLRLVNEYENPSREALLQKRASVLADLVATAEKKSQRETDLALVVEQLEREYQDYLDRQAHHDALETDLQLKYSEFMRLYDTSASTYEAEKEVLQGKLGGLEAEYRQEYFDLVTGKITISKKEFDHGLKRDTYKRVVRQLDEIDLTVLTKATNLVLVDPPVIPDRKVKPKRTLIVIAALLAAFIFSSSFVIGREYLQEARLSRSSVP